MLRGEYVILRAPEISDALIICAWQSDREVTKFLPFVHPISQTRQCSIIKQASLDRNNITLIIETEDEIPIGLCSLKNIDWINSTAEISVIIYAKSCWGREYGYDAVKTLTNFGMFEINLFTIYANIIEDNERAIKCFQKVGYEIEGVLYDRLFKEGKPKNLVSMSISKGRKLEG